jgi:hypothetical protein
MIEKSWNQVQGELFRLSYKRAKRAISSGFYLEAVSLSESLILNRIEVVLRNSAGVSYERFSVGRALNGVESHKIPLFDEGLLQETKIWVQSRNFLSHHFARVEGDLKLTWRARLSESKSTAIQGLFLANRWSRESRKHKQ